MDIDQGGLEGANMITFAAFFAFLESKYMSALQNRTAGTCQLTMTFVNTLPVCGLTLRTMVAGVLTLVIICPCVLLFSSGEEFL